MVLVDGGLSAALRSFSTGSFVPARGRVPKMLVEEEFHASLGAAWYRRLAESGGEALEFLTRATNVMLPSVLAWVGASDDAAQTMVDAGVIGPAAERIDSFLDSVRDLTALAGVDIDAAKALEDWDPARGRTPGHPSEESVERARGDRNRALFVE